MLDKPKLANGGLGGLRISHTMSFTHQNANKAKYAALLKEIDRNGDGDIDEMELVDALDKFLNRERRMRHLKWVILGLVVFSLFLVAAMTGVTYAVVVLSRDTSVSSGALTSKASGTTLRTAQGYLSIDASTPADSSQASAGRRRLLQAPTPGPAKPPTVATGPIPNVRAKKIFPTAPPIIMDLGLVTANTLGAAEALRGDGYATLNTDVTVKKKDKRSRKLLEETETVSGVVSNWQRDGTGNVASFAFNGQQMVAVCEGGPQCTLFKQVPWTLVAARPLSGARGQASPVQTAAQSYLKWASAAALFGKSVKGATVLDELISGKAYFCGDIDAAAFLAPAVSTFEGKTALESSAATALGTFLEQVDSYALELSSDLGAGPSAVEQKYVPDVIKDTHLCTSPLCDTYATIADGGNPAFCANIADVANSGAACRGFVKGNTC